MAGVKRRLRAITPRGWRRPVGGRRLTRLQHGAPSSTVRGKLGPLLVVETKHVECLPNGAAAGHARRAQRPLVRHPYMRNTLG